MFASLPQRDLGAVVAHMRYAKKSSARARMKGYLNLRRANAWMQVKENIAV
jgi:hypothetical protein